MAIQRESCLDHVETLLASVYKREELDCVFQLCALQKIQVGSGQVQISTVLLHSHGTGVPISMAGAGYASLTTCLCVCHTQTKEELVDLQGIKSTLFHRIMDWFGLGGTLKLILFNLLP